ncbi:SLAC1 anion channel family protein [Marivita sp. S0852]|uniref:SLAC1 anion channel family protein n=1 Tax=Marivita sp. S0852 TaxID=3373893 RepID=UPI0039825BB7
MTKDAAGTETLGRLAHFPITIFGITMGLFGLALALRAGGFGAASMSVMWISAAVFLALITLYGVKAIRFPAHVAGEWSHPVKLSFFPAANISILLLSILLQGQVPAISAALWMLGAGVQAVLTLVIVTAWISHRAFTPEMMSPAWFIPAVANAIVPLGGMHLGFIGISWYFFSIAVLFWSILLTLVFNRLIFHDPLPGKLRPTLVILIAPPSIAFLAWIELTGGTIDAMAHVLLNLGLFFAALVAIQVPALVRLPFALSFWALSFPLAALTTALFRFAALSGVEGYHMAANGLLVLLCLIILVLGIRTVRAAMAGDICQPD